jgi:hypothetical protein
MGEEGQGQGRRMTKKYEGHRWDEDDGVGNEDQGAEF